MRRARLRWSRRLLHLVYDGLYLVFLVVSAPYFAWRVIRDPGLRSSILGRFGAGPARARRRAEGDSPCVWIHGVSVGEVKAAGSLVEALADRRPDLDLVISSTTPAGFQLARRLHADRLVVQFPLDLSFVVRRVLRRIRPSVIVLLELEIWPNLLDQATRRGIPVLIVNGRISQRSFRGYSSFRFLLPDLDRIAVYSVQNEEYAERLRRLGVPGEKVVITGNLKYDSLRLECDGAELERCREQLGLAPGARVVVAGSTHPGEEEALLELAGPLRAESPPVRLVLAPRHVERAAEVVRLLERHGLEAATLTRVRAEGRPPAANAVLVVDTIGELETFYGLADVVFVGGSLVSRGGHNILEPAGLGKPVLFGPSMENFREEVRLLQAHEAGLQVADRGELQREIVRLLRNPVQAAELGRRARRAILDVRGTTERNLELVLAHVAA